MLRLISSVSSHDRRELTGLARFSPGPRRHQTAMFPHSSTMLTPPLSLRPSGQFLLEESRPLEAADMAERAAQLDSGEFDVVFSAAHMFR